MGDIGAALRIVGDYLGTPAAIMRYALGLGGTGRAMAADSIDAEDDAARWRALESEARTLAGRMTDREPKRIMLFIAEGYKLLRQRAESRSTQKIER